MQDLRVVQELDISRLECHAQLHMIQFRYLVEHVEGRKLALG
jgi:hypothetical protein